MTGVTFVVFVVEVAGVRGVRSVVIKEEVAETDGGEARFSEFGEDGGGVVDVRSESKGVEKLDVVIAGEAGHGVFSVAGGVEVGFGNEGGDNAGATSGKDAEEGIFRGGELRRFDVEATCGAGFEGFAVFAREEGLFATGGEVDFAGGALSAGGDGVRNRGR